MNIPNNESTLMAEYIKIAQEIEKYPRRASIERLLEMAEINFSPAIHTLSVCYERGIGVKQDSHIAARYCVEAAKLGNPAALHNLGCNYLEGKYYTRDPYKALACFISAANKGYVLSAHCAGWLHDNGDDGVERNGEAARMAYEWAFKHGYTQSANNLGVFYLNGRHTAPNIAKGEEWLRKGIVAGCTKAEANLSKLQHMQRNNQFNSLGKIRSYAEMWIDSIPF